MTTRLEYLLGMANDRSDWLLTSNPSLNYILVKDSGSLMYPEPSVTPLNRFFSTSGLTEECDECFKKSYKDYEEKLKQLNSDYDDSLELMNVGLDVCFFDFLKQLAEELVTALIMFILVRVQFAFPKPNPINNKVKELLDKFKKFYGINSKPGMRGFDTQTHLGGWFSKGGRTAKDSPERWWRKEAAQKEEDWLMRGGSGPEPTPPIPYSLEKSFRDVVREIRNEFKDPEAWLNFLKGLLSGFVEFLIQAGLACLMLDQVADLFKVFGNVFDCMDKECQNNAERCRNNLAAKYAAVDQYYQDLAKCYKSGCCDNPGPCKGIGGWCTRIRDGADFSFYIPCCSVCDCDGDTSCKYAYCSSCDPDSKCPGKEDDLDTNDTQSNTLPSYLFPQNPSTLQQGCPPVPPGWQRHPNGTDPDPRSSPEWKIPTIYPCPSDVTDELSYVWKWWEEFFGGGGGGGGSGGGTTTTTAD